MKLERLRPIFGTTRRPVTLLRKYKLNFRSKPLSIGRYILATTNSKNQIFFSLSPMTLSPCDKLQLAEPGALVIACLIEET